MRLPKKISPSPIAEALVEIRFSPQIPSDAVFGVFFNAVKEKYVRVESLPILQIPEALRVRDPNLFYKPTHKLFNSNFILQVGPKVIVFSNINEYVGWNIFYEKIIELFDIIFKINIIDSTEVLFLRYIDVFDGNVFNNFNLQLSLGGTPFNGINKNITAEIREGDYIHKLKVAELAEIKIGDKQIFGSAIDIQTMLLITKDIILPETYKDILNDMHSKGKILFFKLLKEDFIALLNPEY